MVYSLSTEYSKIPTGVVHILKLGAIFQNLQVPSVFKVMCSFTGGLAIERNLLLLSPNVFIRRHAAKLRGKERDGLTVK